MLSAHDAVALCRLLEPHHIRYLVMGGWGMDALVGRETRPHKDLDLLVLLATGGSRAFLGDWSAARLCVPLTP